MSKITVTLVPRKPTYQTVEWQIETETDYLTGETTTITQDNPSKLGTIKTKKVNGEDREVIFESTGYPGKVVLRPYIKHGKGADGDFISENPDERIIVKIATTEPVVTANTITSTNGTDEDDKITLSAKITSIKEVVGDTPKRISVCEYKRDSSTTAAKRGGEITAHAVILHPRSSQYLRLIPEAN